MKKFRIIYFIIIILCMLMIFTKGVTPSMVIYENTDKDVIDGMYTKDTLSIFNCVTITLIMIFSLLLTCIKKNTAKEKWLYFVVIILLLLFVPLGIHHYEGGFAGKVGENYFYLWNCVIP